jgi:hypothetical protein
MRRGCRVGRVDLEELTGDHVEERRKSEERGRVYEKGKEDIEPSCLV